MVAGKDHQLPIKISLKFFQVVSSLIYFVRRFIRDRAKTNWMSWRKQDMNYPTFVILSKSRIKRPEVKTDWKDRMPEASFIGNQGATPRLLSGRLLQNHLMLGRQQISRILNVSSVTRRDTMLTKAPMQRRKMGREGLLQSQAARSPISW